MSPQVERPPGPRFGPTMQAFQKDPLGTLLRLRAEFGDVVFVGGPIKAYVLANPADARYVFVDNFSNWPHPDRFDALFAAAAGGVATLSGDEWRERRALVEPGLAAHALPFEAAVEEAVTRLLTRLEAHADGGVVDISAEMHEVGRDVLGRLVFGDAWTAEQPVLIASTEGFIRYLDRKMGSPLVMVPEFLPIPTHVRQRRAGRLFDSSVYPLLARYRAVSETADVIGHYVHQGDASTSASMTDDELRGELAIAYVAGYVPIRAALTWTWHLLAANPDAADRLHGEVADVLEGRRPTAADAPRLEYVTMVVKETLRLFPPLALLARQAVADDTIAGYHVPRRSIAVASPYVIHRHPGHWEEPERFKPERFDSEHPEDGVQNAWLPFAVGPRQCPGMDLAMASLVLIVSAVAQQYRLEARAGEPPARPMLALEVREPLQMTLIREKA